MKTNEKRHHKIEMTPEAKALRELRLDRELSIREVCKQLGKSEGYLRHIETGRRDFPRKIVLVTILEVYGATYKMFRHKVRAVAEAESLVGPREELKYFIDRFSEKNITILLKMAKSIVK